jgi:predicted kinase
MEAVVFIGLQASGKSSFYKDRFFSTHVRISLDLLRTRHRHQRMLRLCLETQLPFVVDNTNVTRKERQSIVDLARQHAYSISGYYFRSKVSECLLRNQLRGGDVPDVAIPGTAKRLELPSLGEGFDRLNYVSLSSSGFVIEDWRESSDGAE